MYTESHDMEQNVWTEEETDILSIISKIKKKQHMRDSK